MDYARAPWTLFSFRSGMTKYDRRWRHSLCTIGVILSTNVITLERETKNWDCVGSPAEALRVQNTFSPKNGEMSPENVSGHGSLAAVDSKGRALYLGAGRIPERVISGPQQEQPEGALGGRVSTAVYVRRAFARGVSEGRVSPQFVSQDETTGQWTKLVYFIGTGLLSRRFM